MSNTESLVSLGRALRWQLWLRAMGVADIASGVLTLFGGNWFGKLPSFALRVATWQLDHDPKAMPRAESRRRVGE